VVGFRYWSACQGGEHEPRGDTDEVCESRCASLTRSSGPMRRSADRLLPPCRADRMSLSPPRPQSRAAVNYGGGPGVIRRVSYAHIASSTRFRAPSLAMTLARCVFTVLRLMCKESAIS